GRSASCDRPGTRSRHQPLRPTLGRIEEADHPSRDRVRHFAHRSAGLRADLCCDDHRAHRTIARFATRHHFATYNATAPIEASSRNRVRHRLNPRGNRQLNWAIHFIAVSKLRHDSPGRAYYGRKIAEGKTTKEAIRALKRRLSDVIHRHLVADQLPLHSL
ncbi:MAG: transposase, partial [Microthrixaceae bacterium]